MALNHVTARVIERSTSDGQPSVWWYCPGCGGPHRIDGRWQVRGPDEQPTFSPSVLCNSPPVVCHCYVRDGQIEFLSDSTHALAGKTVPMVPWEAW